MWRRIQTRKPRHEPDTRVDFVVEADPSLEISRMVFQTPGSIAHNFDVPVGAGYETNVSPAALPIAFTARARTR